MSDINNLKVGFARVNITPMMGINISGYFKVRLADGVLDDLEINAIAVNSGKNTVLMLSIDLCGINAETLKEFRGAYFRKNQSSRRRDLYFLHAYSHRTDDVAC